MEVVGWFFLSGERDKFRTMKNQEDSDTCNSSPPWNVTFMEIQGYPPTATPQEIDGG